MTTPGRQAGPTAADGEFDPRTGGYPGDAIPAGDADYGLAPDTARAACSLTGDSGIRTRMSPGSSAAI